MPGENDGFFSDVTAGMARGDEESYRQFYDACFDQIYRHLLVRTRGDENLAQELAQAVLVRIARYVQPFAGERVFWAWVYQLCRSAQVDWLRRNGRNVPWEMLEIWQEQIAPETEGDRELIEHLEQAVESLEDGDRELIKFAYSESLSQRAIAERLQSTPKAVESRLAADSPEAAQGARRKTESICHRLTNRSCSKK